MKSSYFLLVSLFLIAATNVLACSDLEGKNSDQGHSVTGHLTETEPAKDFILSASPVPKNAWPKIFVTTPIPIQEAAKFEAGDGLIGWAILIGEDKEPLVVYTNQAGDRLLIGSLFTPERRELTREAMKQIFGEPKSSMPPKKVFAQAEKSRWIALGAEKPKQILYVFFDPLCPHCHNLAEMLEPLYKEGVQARFLMVGLRDKSKKIAAAVLSDSSPKKRLEDIIHSEFGAFSKVDDKITKDAEKDLAHNMALFDSAGFGGTPAMIWRDASGKVMKLEGAPPSREALEKVLEWQEPPENTTTKD